MDGAGEQVLASAGLADDEHVAVRVGRAQGLLDGVAEDRIVAAQRFDRAHRLVGLPGLATAGQGDQPAAADVEHGADAELGGLDEVAVDAGAVPRLAVAHHERAVGAPLDRAVRTRDVRIADDDVTAIARADDPASLLEVELVLDAVVDDAKGRDEVLGTLVGTK